jgi:hypothetical protein
MCRNIKTLAHQEPPATDAQIRASAEQFVRKLSGLRKAPKDRQSIFDEAADEITQTTRRLIDALEAA